MMDVHRPARVSPYPKPVLLRPAACQSILVNSDFCASLIPRLWGMKSCSVKDKETREKLKALAAAPVFPYFPGVSLVQFALCTARP